MRTTRPPVPWRDVVRYAISIPAPLALAVAVEGGIEPGPVLSAGVFATMGSLVATQAPKPGPLRDRIRRTVAATGFGVVGPPRRPVRHRRGLGAGRRHRADLGGRGADQPDQPALSLGSLQLLVYTALASGLVTPLSSTVEVAFFLAGAAWATLDDADPDPDGEPRPGPHRCRHRLHPHRRAPGRRRHRRGRAGPTGAHQRPERRLRPGDPQPQPYRGPGQGAVRAGRGPELRRALGRGRGRDRPERGARRSAGRRRRPRAGRCAAHRRRADRRSGRPR